MALFNNQSSYFVSQVCSVYSSSERCLPILEHTTNATCDPITFQYYNSFLKTILADKTWTCEAELKLYQFQINKVNKWSFVKFRINKLLT